MQLSDFYYSLPQELIARYPLATRSASRMMCVDRQQGTIQHRQFIDLLDFITSKDLLVFNNTKVIPARLYGEKASGGKVEIMLERILDSQQVLAMLKASKAPKPGTPIFIAGQHCFTVQEKQANFFLLSVSQDIFQLLETWGEMPLPPYLNRQAETADDERYQTVYAKEKGAVAAPTAGLHFDQAMFDKLAEKNVQTAYVTLHVGAGTFQPVRVNNIKQHVMHKEYAVVPKSVVDAVKSTKARGGKVIAVGTTSVRSLETAAQSGTIQPYEGDTDIFIYPGYEFKCINGLLTNFHLPESTLLMLISAFAGYELVMRAYEWAVEEKYRFFSYGDAMLLL